MTDAHIALLSKDFPIHLGGSSCTRSNRIDYVVLIECHESVDQRNRSRMVPALAPPPASSSASMSSSAFMMLLHPPLFTFPRSITDPPPVPSVLGSSSGRPRSVDPTHPRPFVPSIKSHFWKISSTFGDKCPQNGSKNGLRAPRTGMGCPHIGSSVALSLVLGT